VATGASKTAAIKGAIALHRALCYEKYVLETFRQTVERLAIALETKHLDTHDHSLNVARLAKITASPPKED